MRFCSILVERREAQVTVFFEEADKLHQHNSAGIQILNETHIKLRLAPTGILLPNIVIIVGSQVGSLS
jgi:hypothetical protein